MMNGDLIVGADTGFNIDLDIINSKVYSAIKMQRLNGSLFGK